jgi:hypothetical protein
MLGLGAPFAPPPPPPAALPQGQRQYTQVMPSPFLRCDHQPSRPSAVYDGMAYSCTCPHLETLAVKTIPASCARFVKDQPGGIEVRLSHLLITAMTMSFGTAKLQTRYSHGTVFAYCCFFRLPLIGRCWFCRGCCRFLASACGCKVCSSDCSDSVMRIAGIRQRLREDMVQFGCLHC